MPAIAATAALTVSKRLQPVAAALLCLTAMQLVGLGAASCHPEPLPMGAVRVALTR